MYACTCCIMSCTLCICIHYMTLTFVLYMYPYCHCRQIILLFYCVRLAVFITTKRSTIFHCLTTTLTKIPLCHDIMWCLAFNKQLVMPYIMVFIVHTLNMNNALWYKRSCSSHMMWWWLHGTTNGSFHCLSIRLQRSIIIACTIDQSMKICCTWKS